MKNTINEIPKMINKNSKILIVGDSHTQTSLNPSLMDETVNLSFSNESPMFSYYKAKYIIERVPSIKILVLGFSYNNIADVQEKLIVSTPVFLDNTFILMNEHGRREIEEKSLNLYSYYIAKYYFGIPLNIYKNSYILMNLPNFKSKYFEKIMGGYKEMKSANIAKQMEKMKTEIGKTDYSISPLLVEYTDKLAKLCREKGIMMYIINTPIYSAFYERYSANLISSYDSIVQILLNDNENLLHLDFRNFTQDTCLFYDGEHLNTDGAELFSPFINNLIKGVSDAL